MPKSLYGVFMYPVASQRRGVAIVPCIYTRGFPFLVLHSPSCVSRSCSFVSRISRSSITHSPPLSVSRSPFLVPPATFFISRSPFFIFRLPFSFLVRRFSLLVRRFSFLVRRFSFLFRRFSFLVCRISSVLSSPV